MSDSSSNNLEERISAYLDGELSGEEARAVQEELERSPAARDLLRQYGDLRNLIRELPGETLPEEHQTEIQSHV
ncbi:MAG: zf-HC2 domain-containing protein, partial [Planctomycetaceae bacterium]|nr:zf-HC2 domain-containing protein [Planctomycetaceae bacterium]